MDIDSITINEASTEDSTCSKFFPFSKYNLFSFGDVVQSNIDWEGRGSIGGNATFYNFGIGKGIVPKPDPNVDKTLVVGGNLKWYDGVNYAGNTIMTPNGTYTPTNVIYSNTSLYQPLREDPLPIDFKSAYNYSSCLSNKLSTTKSEGNTTILNCHGTI